MNVKRNFIGGEWVGASAAKPNVNRSDTRDVVGEYAQADAAQMAGAVLAARAAFPAWAGGSIQARADSLEKIAAEASCRASSMRWSSD